jgi:hypothetical protein
MATDDMQEAEDKMAEQERWGLGQSDMVLIRIVRLVKLARVKYAELEARVRALEGK